MSLRRTDVLRIAQKKRNFKKSGFFLYVIGVLVSACNCTSLLSHCHSHALIEKPPKLVSSIVHWAYRINHSLHRSQSTTCANCKSFLQHIIDRAYNKIEACFSACQFLLSFVTSDAPAQLLSFKLLAGDFTCLSVKFSHSCSLNHFPKRVITLVYSVFHTVCKFDSILKTN